MKIVRKFIPAVILYYLFNPQSVLAVTTSWGTDDNCIEDGAATLRCIPVIFQNIINWILAFAGVVALFLIIWAGIKYIRSGGEEEKIKSARETLTYAIIGLVVILLSFAIINIISAITGVGCIKQFGFGNCP